MRNKWLLGILIWAWGAVAWAGIPQDGLVSYWQANGNAQDSHGNNDGQLINGTSYGSGIDGQAFVFDGVDDYVQIGDQADLDFSTQFTLAAWIYPTGDGAEEHGGIIVNKEGSYEFARFQDGSLRWAVNNSSPGWAWINTRHYIPLREWTHVAISYDGALMYSYVNGELVHVQRAEGPITPRYTVRRDFRIGGRQSIPGLPPSQFFTGAIDEVAVYRRAMNLDDIRQVMYRGNPPPLPPVESVPTLSEWGLIMLGMLLAGIAGRSRLHPRA